MKPHSIERIPHGICCRQVVAEFLLAVAVLEDGVLNASHVLKDKQTVSILLHNFEAFKFQKRPNLMGIVVAAVRSPAKRFFNEIKFTCQICVRLYIFLPHFVSVYLCSFVLQFATPSVQLTTERPPDTPW